MLATSAAPLPTPAAVPGVVHAVSIGEMALSQKPGDLLIAYGLGSCVAVCLYDPALHLAGMIHSLLPSALHASGGGQEGVAKFVDRGVPLLLEAMLKAGANRGRLVVKLAGGAQMLNAISFNSAGTLNIGERNAQAAQEALRALGLRIHAQDTGGAAGRTVRMNVLDGRVTVKTLGEGEVPLA